LGIKFTENDRLCQERIEGTKVMRHHHLVLTLLGTVMFSANVTATNLTKIDRIIAKEPTYKSQPKYCLLVFGPDAKTRIWLVVDGDTLFVDRNANGNLTEKGESIRAQGRVWTIGEIIEGNGKTKHTGLNVANHNGSFLIMMRTSKGLHAEVGNEVGRLQFSERPQDAPIVHLAGPLTVLLRERTGSLALVPGKKAHFIALIGTPGLGEGTSAYYHHDQFETLNMVGEASIPHKDTEKPSLKAKIVPDEFRY
jgi:hypothetical protein